jgi:pimeloyl-ACP methyl ester carboxylesterase
MFANAHPAEVAGMVLIDARSEVVEGSADQEAFASALESQAMQYSLARRFGIARLFGAGLIGEPLVSNTLATRMVLAQTEPNAIAETTAEGLARTADDQVLAAAKLGSMPLTVVAAGESMRNLPGWPEAQSAMAKLSTNGKLVVADKSSHAIHLEEPALIIDVVYDMISAERNGSSR